MQSDSFSPDEAAQRPKGSRAMPMERPAIRQKRSLPETPAPHPSSSFHHPRTSSTVRFQLDRTSRAEPSSDPVTQQQTSLLSTGTLPAPPRTTINPPVIDPSSFREEKRGPRRINILPNIYPPSSSSAHSSDLPSATAPRIHESAGTQLAYSPRSIGRPLTPSTSPSSPPYFPEHPFARNPPISPHNIPAPTVSNPSTVVPFPPWTPDSIQQDKPRPRPRNAKVDRPPRILPRTLFKFGFLFPPLWLVGSMFLCIKHPGSQRSSTFIEEGAQRQTPPTPGRDNSDGMGRRAALSSSSSSRGQQDYVKPLRNAELKWARRSLVAFAIFCVLLSIALGLYLSFGACFRSCSG